MEKLEIYRFQAIAIENTLRMVANALDSHKKENCLDRNVIQSLERMRNVLKGEIDTQVKYV